jgi:hypothetical protein
MNPRNEDLFKTPEWRAGLDPTAFIERVKKMRALNCSFSDIGCDNYILKKMPFNKMSLFLRRFL